MTVIADKIFYCFQKNNNVCDVINDLAPYMWTSAITLDNSIKTTIPVPDKSPQNIIDTTIKNDNSKGFIIPTQRDTLFWSIFIAINGYAEYQMVDRNDGVRKLNVHQDIVSALKKEPSRWKLCNKKTTKVGIEEIYSDLLTNQKSSSLSNIAAYCCYYKQTILIVNEEKQSYLEIVYEDSEETIVLYVDADKTFKLKDGDENINDIKERYLSLEKYDKPLKAISNYKLSDLQEIATKLSLSTTMKKTELYSYITNSIQW